MSRDFWRQIFGHVSFILLTLLLRTTIYSKSLFYEGWIEMTQWKTPVMVTFLLQLQAWGVTVLRKRNSITDAFLWNLWSLQNIFLTFVEDCWATTSNFQHYFERTICFISNKSIQSLLTICVFQKQLLPAIDSIFSENVNSLLSGNNQGQDKFLWLRST